MELLPYPPSRAFLAGLILLTFAYGTAAIVWLAHEVRQTIRPR